MVSFVKEMMYLKTFYFVFQDIKIIPTTKLMLLIVPKTLLTLVFNMQSELLVRQCVPITVSKIRLKFDPIRLFRKFSESRLMLSLVNVISRLMRSHITCPIY
jgi:hypothetical protein